MAIQTSTQIPLIQPKHGLSSPVGFLGTIKATVVRDLIILKRYKANLLGAVIQLLIFALMFYIVSTSASFRGLELSQKGIHTFYLAGMTLIFYGSAIFESPVRTVKEELYNGTLEFVYSTPTNRYAYYTGAIIGKQILFTVFYVPAFIILILVADIKTVNIAYMVGVSIIFILSIVSLGVLVAMAAVIWKNVNSITAIIVTLINFVAGGFLPVSTLPTAAKYIAYFLPFTWGLDLVRYYAFNRTWDTLLPIEYELLILVINALVYGFLSIFLLGKTEKYSKNKGLHLI